MKPRRRKKGLPLPWERPVRILGGVLGGSRLRLFALGTGALAATYAMYETIDEGRRLRATHTAIADVHRAVRDFESDHGRCPGSTEELLHPPRTGARYIRTKPVDGWGHDIWVRCPGRFGDQADVISPGPSGSLVIDDNIM